MLTKEGRDRDATEFMTPTQARVRQTFPRSPLPQTSTQDFQSTQLHKITERQHPTKIHHAMSLPTKRKHVVFDGAEPEAEAQAGPSTIHAPAHIHPDRAGFHPDRAAAIDAAQPAAKKPKVSCGEREEELTEGQIGQEEAVPC